MTILFSFQSTDWAKVYIWDANEPDYFWDRTASDTRMMRVSAIRAFFPSAKPFPFAFEVIDWPEAFL